MKPTPAQFGMSAKNFEDEQRKATEYALRKKTGFWWSQGTNHFIMVTVVSSILGYIFFGIAGIILGPCTIGAVLVGILTYIKIRIVERLKPADSFLKYEQAVEEYEKQQARIEEAHQRRRKEAWTNIGGWEFEHKLADLYKMLGYDTRVTKGSGDGGVDIIAYYGNKKTLIQCKNHKNPIGPKDIRELYGVFIADGTAKECVMVCTGGFTKGATEFASGKPIRLLELQDILKMSEKAFDFI